MRKVRIHTRDIFNFNNARGMKYFDLCHKEALKCGLTCRCITDQPFMSLELWGRKGSFIKYYTKTLLICKKKTDGIKRLISIITT